ncbi:glycoside hydrolase family 3 protein [Liquorilactobacillus ghanensis]|uniref:glycoside hydrolase family 3 protein n=1 Tax=Liquorilactobacillus ghanensis TaxID=399370 RepID=UPI0039ED4A9D
MLLDPTVKVTYDINNIDGMYYMLDKRFQGCLVLPFSKAIDVKKGGTVQVNGNDAYYFIKSLANAGGVFMLGIDVMSYLTDYDQKVDILVADFYDTDGNKMEEKRFDVTAESSNLPTQEQQLSEQEQTALKSAEEGIVLLKNDNQVLPLKDDEILNVFGTAFHKFRTSTVGAGKINPRFTINFKDGISNYSNFALNTQISDLYKFGKELLPDQGLVKKAKELSDIGIVVLSRASGENFDNSTRKGEYYLTDDEKNLLKFVSDNFTKSILILNVGYPIDMSFIKQCNIDGIIYSGYGGMFAGQALVEILDGRVTPSARLPFTWAFDYTDYPASKNFYNSVGKNIPLGADDNHLWVNTHYEEDIYVGYRYFQTFNKSVAFPFGYGLSYTAFEQKVTEFKHDEKDISVTVKVKNNGLSDGKEVVQFYVKKQIENIKEVPAIELVDFLKTDLLKVGEEQVLQTDVPLKQLAVFDEKKSQYVVDSGKYLFYIGKNVEQCQLVGEVDVTKPIIVKTVEHLMQPNQKIERLSKNDLEGTYPKGLKSGINKGATGIEPRGKRKNYSFKFDKASSAKRILFPDIVKDLTKSQAFVSQFNLEELARIVICGSHGWGMEGIGEAGRVYKLDGYDFPKFIVSDGNSGININEKNIGLPSSVSISASFSKALTEKVGRAIGLEARKHDVQLILAPAFNIQRNPLNGRNPEYFSEDPFLSGTMAGYYCKGLESTGVGGCYKHFIANNAEAARKRNQSIISERALRDIYIKNFEIALSVHQPKSVMTAYNSVNGVETSADPELLIGILRKELGFDGFIMTDWSTDSEVDFIRILAAGNNWITPGSNDSTYTDKVIAAVKDGRLSIEMLQNSALYIIKNVAKIIKSERSNEAV